MNSQGMSNEQAMQYMQNMSPEKFNEILQKIRSMPGGEAYTNAMFKLNEIGKSQTTYDAETKIKEFFDQIGTTQQKRYYMFPQNFLIRFPTFMQNQIAVPPCMANRILFGDTKGAIEICYPMQVNQVVPQVAERVQFPFLQ